MSRKKLITGIKILIPAVLLVLVFRSIDIKTLLQELQGANIWLCLASLVIGYISQVFISAWRWKVMLQAIYHIDISYLCLTRLYWEGMFLGHFVPSNLGIDLYRVVNTSRIQGGYDQHIALIVAEKIYILLGSFILLLMSYPLAAIYMTSDTDQINDLMPWLIKLGIVCLLGLALVFGLSKTQRFQTMVETGRHLLGRLLQWLMKLMRMEFVATDHLSTADLIQPLFKWQNILLALGITFVNRMTMAVSGDIMFQAVGVNLPLAVHLFNWTLMFIIFVLPISFGSLGVREWSYILLFSMFGVPKETSLAASFVGLASHLITMLLGGLLLLSRSFKEKTKY
jgi:uncharacterized protein (TIRG00374 family)